MLSLQKAIKHEAGWKWRARLHYGRAGVFAHSMANWAGDYGAWRADRAYQEDEAGALRALLPLAGQTLIEYQARCVAALGAAPVLVLVERVPVALNEAFERLRGEGIAVSRSATGTRRRAGSRRAAMSC